MANVCQTLSVVQKLFWDFDCFWFSRFGVWVSRIQIVGDWDASKHSKKLSTTIQTSGPLIFAVKRYKGHKLNPKNTDIIGAVKDGAVKEKAGHAMMIRGFDYPRRLIKFQNSWGNNSIKWMPLAVYQDIFKYAYYFKGVSIS